MPLVRTWWLGKKKGREATSSRRLCPTHAQPGSGQRVDFAIGTRRLAPPRTDGTCRGGLGRCALHATPPCLLTTCGPRAGRTDGSGALGRWSSKVIGGACTLLHASADQVAARLWRSRLLPCQAETFATNPRWFSPPAYGLTASLTCSPTASSSRYDTSATSSLKRVSAIVRRWWLRRLRGRGSDISGLGG